MHAIENNNTQKEKCTRVSSKKCPDIAARTK